MVRIVLKQLLKHTKMAQSELAERTKIRPSTICDMCNNNLDRINLSHLERICAVLNCDISDVIKLI